MTTDYLSYLQSSTAQAIFRLSQEVMTLLREHLNNQGFVEFLPPIISTITDPGLAGAERVSVSLYDQKAYLTSSMVFHKQILASAFQKIYCFSPNVRLEPCTRAGEDDGRHLVEFCQLDLEEALCTIEDSMALAEGMLVNLHERLMGSCGSLLSFFKHPLTVPKTPFAKFSYDQLFQKAQQLGHSVFYGDDLPESVERAVSQEVGDFFWITDYPGTSRGFYYRSQAGTDKVRSMDLIYPKGFGEAISGGEREYEVAAIKQKIKQRGLQQADFEDFLKMAGPNLKPSSGFGIGVERLIRYLSGVRNIGLVRAFPKMPGQVVM